jgi:acyl carrier protein
VFEGLADVIARAARVDRGRLTPALRLVDLGLDSLAAMEVVVAVERAFDLSLPQGELAALETLGDVARLLEERRARRPGS